MAEDDRGGVFGDTSENTTELLTYRGTMVPLLEPYEALLRSNTVVVYARGTGGTLFVRYPDGTKEETDSTVATKITRSR